MPGTEAYEIEQLITQAAEAMGWSRQTARFAYEDSRNNLEWLRTLAEGWDEDEDDED